MIGEQTFKQIFHIQLCCRPPAEMRTACQGGGERPVLLSARERQVAPDRPHGKRDLEKGQVGHMKGTATRKGNGHLL